MGGVLLFYMGRCGDRLSTEAFLLVRLSLIHLCRHFAHSPAVLILPLRRGSADPLIPNWISSSLPSRPLFQNVSCQLRPLGEASIFHVPAHSRHIPDCSRSGESWRDEQQKQQRKPRCLFLSVATPVCMIAKEVGGGLASEEKVIFVLVSVCLGLAINHTHRHTIELEK